MIAPYIAALLAFSPLALYTFDEANGSATIRDSVNGGVFTNYAATTADATGVTLGQQRLGAGDFGSSAKFAGPAGNSGVFKASYAALGTLGDWDGTTALSWVFHARPNITRSGANTRYTVWGTQSGTTNVRIWLQWNSSTGKAYWTVALTDNSNILRVEYAGDVANAVNQHVAITYDGSRTAAGIKMYINGAQVTTNTITDTFAGHTIGSAQVAWIGGAPSASGEYFAGHLDTLCIIPKALSATEVASLYALSDPTRPIVTPVSTNNLFVMNDPEGDIDGLVGLGVALYAHRQGHIRFKHHACVSTMHWEAPATRAIIDRYNVPANVSSYWGSSFETSPTDWASAVYAAFGMIPNDRRNKYPGTTLAVRRDLMQCADNSVVMLSAGSLGRVQDLMQSGPDIYSHMTGIQLLQRKLKRLVIMGGQFPMGVESNFSFDIPAAQYVLNNLPASIETILIGYDMGWDVYTGNGAPAGSPIRLGVDTYGAQNPAEMNNGERSSWDAIAMLVAIYGLNNGMFGVAQARGRVSVDGSGSSSMAVDTSADHTYLTRLASAATVRSSINGMLATLN